VTPPHPRTPIAVDRQTQEQIAGTAELLLERFCQGQRRGQRVFDGKPFYTVVERGRDLNIEVRGDAYHLPEMPAIATKPNSGNGFLSPCGELRMADF